MSPERAEIRVDPLTGLRTVFAPAALELTREAPRPAATPEPFAAALHPGAAAPPREAKLDLFTSQAAGGAHELLAEHPHPLADLDDAAFAGAVERWRERLGAHAEAPARHLLVDEDDGGSRTELWAPDFVPALLARERERFSAYATRTLGANLLMDLLQEEVRLRARVVAIDREAVLLSSYAAPAPFALMLVPRTARPRFEDPGPTGTALLHRGLKALRERLGPRTPLSLWVRTAPSGAEHFCWHVDVVPRPLAQAGLELGTGLHRNPVLPERAAAELREAFPADRADA